MVGTGILGGNGVDFSVDGHLVPEQSRGDDIVVGFQEFVHPIVGVGVGDVEAEVIRVQEVAERHVLSKLAASLAG
jgi:hypothetical protein